jgi:hypothetical protein
LGTKSKLHESEWRQGSLIPWELIPENTLPAGVNPESRFIIVSHSCDIVQGSYDAEPSIEFLIAEPLDSSQENGTFFRGKNPRVLQLWGETANGKQLFQISVHNRFRMPRITLESGSPETACRFSRDDIRIIAFWIAKRYTRSAFPTAFNNRIPDGIIKKLRKGLSKNGQDISGIFVTFFGSDSELADDQDYQIAIRIVVPPEAAVDQNRETRAIIALTEIQQLLAQCKGIELVDIRLESETEFTLEDLKLSRAWDFDYLSAVEEE